MRGRPAEKLKRGLSASTCSSRTAAGSRSRAGSLLYAGSTRLGQARARAPDRPPALLAALLLTHCGPNGLPCRRPPIPHRGQRAMRAAANEPTSSFKLYWIKSCEVGGQTGAWSEGVLRVPKKRGAKGAAIRAPVPQGCWLAHCSYCEPDKGCSFNHTPREHSSSAQPAAALMFSPGLGEHLGC